MRPYPADHQGRTNQACTACHQPSIPPESPAPAAGSPPAIPHDLAGRAECLGCHGSGVASVPQVPQFHKDYQFPNTACLTCHKPAGGLQPAPAPTTPTPTPSAAATSAPATVAPTGAAPTNTPTTAPTTAAATAVPKATATTAPATGGAPLQPKDHVARTVCLACHSTGAAPAPPADHAGRTDATCATCHKPQ